MQISKKGIRALGVAESFAGREKAVICGVSMRKDLRIDGAGFGYTTIGGNDATDSVINLVSGFKRDDINVILIGGCVISWFNVLSLSRIFSETGIPVICVTYEESDGLAGHISHHFPGDNERLARYQDLGQRIPWKIKTGYTLFFRAQGLSDTDAGHICEDFTHDGKIPEPVKIARLIARGFMQCTMNSK